MVKIFSCFTSKLAFIMVCVLLMIGGCSAPKHEGFAVYLSKGDIPPAQIHALSHIDITEQPVILINDINQYNVQTHEITLTTDAFDRITSLEVPVRGRSFVVCVDRKLIYSGAFWTPVSSVSFDGVTILKPLDLQKTQVIKLELGYPSSSFYKGEDPRNNPEIMESLKRAGKLMSTLSIPTAEKLPHSMKGYELYSWLDGETWHFVLITGTNRNKPLKEVVSGINVVSEDGWVQLQVEGVDEIKAVLSRLTREEYVFWAVRLREEQTYPADIIISLPTKPAVDAIQEHARQCGLNFHIQIP